jgi:hypothetical protein
MKKLRVSLMALALTVGIAGAFANQSVHKSAVKHFDTLWQDANPDGTTKTIAEGGVSYSSEANAVAETGCGSGTIDCATNVLVVDGPSQGSYIFHN